MTPSIQLAGLEPKRRVGPAVVVTDCAYAFDPASGNAYRWTFEGTHIGVVATANWWRSHGAKVDVSQQGPHWRCIVTAGGELIDGYEAPIDQWAINCDELQVSIWAHPRFESLLVAAATKVSGSVPDALKDLKRIITNAAESNSSIPDATLNALSTDNRALAQAAYSLLLRDCPAYEVKRPTLRRIRTYSPKFTSRLSIDPVEKFYSSAALMELPALAMPAAVQALMPENPSSSLLPVGTQWGWKLRTQTSDYSPAAMKIVETIEFVFSAWSTVLYDYITVTI